MGGRVVPEPVGGCATWHLQHGDHRSDRRPRRGAVGDPVVLMPPLPGPVMLNDYSEPQVDATATSLFQTALHDQEGFPSPALEYVTAATVGSPIAVPDSGTITITNGDVVGCRTATSPSSPPAGTPCRATPRPTSGAGAHGRRRGGARRHRGERRVGHSGRAGRGLGVGLRRRRGGRVP